MIVYLYYYCLLRLTTYTGFGLTNEDSRATSIFTVVFIFTLGSIFNIAGVKVLNFSWFINVGIVLLCFNLFYYYFKRDKVKSKMGNAYEQLNPKSKYILMVFSVLYTILSAITFIKTV